MQVVTAREAVSLIEDGDTLLIGGSGGGHAVPECLIAALQERYREEQRPRHITLLHPVGLGDEETQGVGRLADDGLVGRIITGTLVDSPALAELALGNRIEAYTLPQGVLSQLMREMAAGRPGLITHVGLHTFIDPRHGGGRQSGRASEDLVEVIELEGREWLFFKPYAVDVAFLRGTTADEEGNVTMEREAVFGEMLSMAQATRRNNGVVVVQVERIAERRTLPAKMVKIPGMLVDLVVLDPGQRQTYRTAYSPAYAGELRVPLSSLPVGPLDARKVVARRAALELFPGAICNLGSGICTGIATLAAEEGILDSVILTNEQGLIGGAPAGGTDAGAALNFSALIDQPYQFDFYDGGGLDLAFLSFGQVDGAGNVNVSRLGDRIIGVGGFVNISQNAKKVIFGGTFTAGGLEVELEGGRVVITTEGRFRRFVSTLDQLSFNASYTKSRGQEILYVTERAVFSSNLEGLVLTEIAPGLDVERDVLSQMDFQPDIARDLRLMDSRIFEPSPMGLRRDLAARAGRVQPPRLGGVSGT